MDVEVIIEGHEQRIKILERDMSAMKEVQAEIRSMNETLVTLANELKHTNEYLASPTNIYPLKRLKKLLIVLNCRDYTSKGKERFYI